MTFNLALKVHDHDNVATVFANGVQNGSTVEVHDKKGSSLIITVHELIPFGHKIALESIEKGSKIIKYGEEIGMATQNIQCGEYVHVHNLDSMRGRGDL